MKQVKITEQKDYNLKRVWINSRPFGFKYTKFIECEVDKVTGKCIKTNRVETKIEGTWLASIIIAGMLVGGFYTSLLLPYIFK